MFVNGLKSEAPNKRKEIPVSHWKYVDDLTVAEALDLKTCLESNNNQVRPLSYHNRTEHVLPPENSKVQTQLNEIEQYASDNEMKVSTKKTKIMLFNTAKVRDFTPDLMISGEKVEYVEEAKLLGVKITSDLKWNANTEHIVKMGYQKLWMIRRLKANGANTSELCDIYIKHVRSVIEYSAEVWHSGLTEQNRVDIERVQKAAFAIFLGKAYQSYENALTVLNMKKLDERRETLCLKSARKSAKSASFASWFVPDNKLVNTRRVVKQVKKAQARTTRFSKSALPYMTRLLNNNPT